MNPSDAWRQVLGMFKSLQGTSQSAPLPYDQEGQSAQDHSLFYNSDKFPLTALHGLRTKKIWEKPIGAKHNVNDELNHIAQQSSLNRIGLQMFTVSEAKVRAQQSQWQHQ